EPREALRVVVADEEDERERRQHEAERVQHPRRDDHQQRAHDRQRAHLARAQEPSWHVPPGRPGIRGVDEAVDDAVRRHGARAAADHRGRHPAERPPARPAAGGEHHGDVGERQGEHRVLELDRRKHTRQLAQSPYSFQRRVTCSRISTVITISSGQGWTTSSSALFSVASTPSLPPYRWRSAAWSRSSIGPSMIMRSRRGSMLPVARQATSERSWTFTCSLTTTIVLASIMSPIP